MFYIIGLGNPGEEYAKTRHNVGRIVLGDFIKKENIGELNKDKKLQSLVSSGKEKIGRENFQIIFPETYMNKSGLSLKPLVNKIIKKKKIIIKEKKKDVLWAENLIVIHDDLDIGLGNFKISFGKSAGGHKGVDSIVKNLKTLNFIRIRIGVSPANAKGKVKRPDSSKIMDFIIKEFRPQEFDEVKKVSKKTTLVLSSMMKDGLAKTMSLYN